MACHDQTNYGISWRNYGFSAFKRAVDLICVALIYFISELLIWVLSLALRPAGLAFLASILGMFLVMTAMILVGRTCDRAEGWYGIHIKPKVDFINKNLGVGFPVPMIAISREETLGGGDIGRVIGNFLTTNALFWALVFLLAWGILVAVLRLPRKVLSRERSKVNTRIHGINWVIEPPRLLGLPPVCFDPRASSATTLPYSSTGNQTEKDAALGDESRTVSVYFTDSECPTLVPPGQPSQVFSDREPEEEKGQGGPFWDEALFSCYPILLSAFFLVVVGIPVAHQTGDHRVLDGCVLWFVWISSVRLQAAFNGPPVLPATCSWSFVTAAQPVLATLLNPVLLTTLAMTGYTRAKSAATNVSIDDTLADFSSGTSLADLWSSSVGQYTLRDSQRDYFGAGDAALSLLECGIVVWGFKLYKCRAQLARPAGLAVAVLSAAAAALNVFAGTLLGRGMGLAPPEALAFAARSTTLALARPAMEALGGNQVVNAALVVSNGILGQLLYPFVLRRLDISLEDNRERGRKDECEETGGLAGMVDDAKTIAAGTAIGVNGAAMGVAYLYEKQSRAAPYAALSMTTFGVLTVIFTAVDPFTSALKALAQ